MKSTGKMIVITIAIFCVLSGCNINDETSPMSDPVSSTSSISISENTETTTESTAGDSDYTIDPQFVEASPFNSAGHAVVGDIVGGEKKYGVINEEGEYIIEPRFDYYDLPTFELLRKTNIDNSIIWVQEGEYWSIINADGEWLSDHLFEGHTYFSKSGFAGIKKDGLWGFCNSSGEIVIEPQFDEVSMFSEKGFAAVRVDGKWGTVDETGQVIIEPQFTHITFDGDLTDSFIYWSDGGADIYMIDNGDYGYGLISETGEILVEQELLFPPVFAECGLAQVETEDGYAYMNTSGQIVIEAYEATDFSAFKNGFASLKKLDDEGNEYCVFIDESGKTIGTKHYDEVGSFSDSGLASAALNGMYGYIDVNGEFLIAPQFDSAGTFGANGYAVVSKNAKYAVLSESGELMTDFVFDECIKTRSNAMSLPFSTFIVKRDNQWELVNEKGELLAEAKLDDVWFSDQYTYEGDFFLNLSEDYLGMTISENKKGIISLQGEILFDPVAEQESMIVSPNGMTAVCVDGKYGYIDLIE